MQTPIKELEDTGGKIERTKEDRKMLRRGFISQLAISKQKCVSFHKNQRLTMPFRISLIYSTIIYPITPLLGSKK